MTSTIEHPQWTLNGLGLKAVEARLENLLETALPISADIAALAGIGLDAVAAIESGHVPGSDWRRRAKELLDHSPYPGAKALWS